MELTVLLNGLKYNAKNIHKITNKEEKREQRIIKKEKSRLRRNNRRRVKME